MLNGHLFLCFKDLFWFFMILWHSTLGWPWLHRIVKKVHNVLYKVTLTRSQGSVILTCIQANDVEQLPLKVCMLVFSATKCCYRRWILQTWSVITLCTFNIVLSHWCFSLLPGCIAVMLAYRNIPSLSQFLRILCCTKLPLWDQQSPSIYLHAVQVLSKVSIIPKIFSCGVTALNLDYLTASWQ